jgi:diguanylate cyclase (GGDEF)-like protein
MRELELLATTDELTGLHNRRSLQHRLKFEVARARRFRTPLTALMIDLDHFKALNDSQGHQDGDEALRAVAALLAERTQSRGGLVARFGGEEFAWLMPGVPLEAARAEAEAFRIRVREAHIRHIASDGGIVTASLGVSASNGEGALTPLTLIRAADAALYRAKSRGRDRVEIAHP